jgi:hypothetical protein
MAFWPLATASGQGGWSRWGAASSGQKILPSQLTCHANSACLLGVHPMLKMVCRPCLLCLLQLLLWVIIMMHSMTIDRGTQGCGKGCSWLARCLPVAAKGHASARCCVDGGSQSPSGTQRRAPPATSPHQSSRVMGLEAPCRVEGVSPATASSPAGLPDPAAGPGGAALDCSPGGSVQSTVERLPGQAAAAADEEAHTVPEPGPGTSVLDAGRGDHRVLVMELPLRRQLRLHVPKLALWLALEGVIMLGLVRQVSTESFGGRQQCAM